MPALFGAVTCEKDHGKRETQLTNPPPALFRSLCNGVTDSCAVTFGFLACSLGTVPSPIALVTLLHRSLGLEAPLVAESALGISARQAPWLNIPISLSAKFLGLLHDSALLALPAIIAMPWLLLRPEYAFIIRMLMIRMMVMRRCFNRFPFSLVVLA